MTTQYRVLCTLAPNWNRVPANRMSKAEAEKKVKIAEKTCPGVHRVEAINE